MQGESWLEWQEWNRLKAQGSVGVQKRNIPSANTCRQETLYFGPL